MAFNNLCTPALLYLLFSLTQIVIDTVKGLYNTALVKIFVTFVFTIMLNSLCNQGLGVISWIIVFIPFILMTVIVAVLLLMFGLDPMTGKLRRTNAMDEEHNKHQHMHKEKQKFPHSHNRFPKCELNGMIKDVSDLESNGENKDVEDPREKNRQNKTTSDNVTGGIFSEFGGLINALTVGKKDKSKLNMTSFTWADDEASKIGKTAVTEIVKILKTMKLEHDAADFFHKGFSACNQKSKEECYNSIVNLVKNKIAQLGKYNGTKFGEKLEANSVLNGLPVPN